MQTRKLGVRWRAGFTRRFESWLSPGLALCARLLVGCVAVLGVACGGGEIGVAAEGRTLFVAQQHPAASDENPGTADKPFKSISRAANEVRSGDRVQIEGGVYRETVIVANSGTKESPIKFEASPGANVVVTGADVLTEWTKEPGDGNVFGTPWPHVFAGWSPSNAHPDDDEHRLIGRCEQVYVDGYELRQVSSRAEMARGTFLADTAARRLLIWDRRNRDPKTARLNVQASTRQVMLEIRGEHVQVRGIRFRHAANQAQAGAVLLKGGQAVLEDCVIEQTNSAGAAFLAPGLVVRRCVFRDNGQLGFTATAADLLISDCLCENNNTKDFSRSWEAGGNKLVLCRNAVIERSVFRGNRGHGVWFDIGNEDCTVRNCLIDGNEDAGIFYEISYRLHAHDNVIVRNGFSSGYQNWGANGGISLSSSAGCRLERNLLVGNKEGVQFREQPRVTNRIGRGGASFAIWNRDHEVRHNVIAWNRDLQVGGWFDLVDDSHWPRAGATEVKLPVGAALDDLVERPAGLSLADLRLNLHDNLYATKPGQTLVQWGCFWRRHVKLTEPDEVRKQLSFDAGSRLVSPEFVDWMTLDLRVPGTSLLASLNCFPQGTVPGVRLK